MIPYTYEDTSLILSRGYDLFERIFDFNLSVYALYHFTWYPACNSLKIYDERMMSEQMSDEISWRNEW